MMAWVDSCGRVWKGRRKNGWPTDVKAPDGGIYYGWRLVSGGRVRFNGSLWAAPDLAKREGTFIRVLCGDYWGSEIFAYLGDEGATPENYSLHHMSFYRDPVYLNPVD